MTTPDSDREIKDYFAAQRPKASTVETVETFQAMANSRTRLKRITTAATAFASLMLLVSVSLIIHNRQLDQRIVDMEARLIQLDGDKGNIPPQDDAETFLVEDDSDQREPATEVAQPVSAPKYRLVAFRSHDDNCPHCRKTGQVFANLKKEIQAKNLTLEQIELQKDEERQATDQRLAELDLTEQIKGLPETAFFMLLDTTGQPLARFQPNAGASQIADSIEDVVDQ